MYLQFLFSFAPLTPESGKHDTPMCPLLEPDNMWKKPLFLVFEIASITRSINSSKMQWKLNLIAAACEDRGIGVNGKLPWKLKSEMKFFSDMTTTTKDEDKTNVVLMGRVTWECIPKKYRPLKNRINMVLTSRNLDLGNEAVVCRSIPDAIDIINNSPLKDKVEKIWVIGGSSVYKASMESPHFHRLYLTDIKKKFECDTFFPEIPEDFVKVTDPNVPMGIQEENGIEFEYNVYEKP